MHELSLMTALVEQIQSVALAEDFNRVIEIRLGVGALSGIEPSCLEFCFDEVARGSVLEGAKLNLDLVGVELFCRKCGQTSWPEDAAALFCVNCLSSSHSSSAYNTGNVEIRKGRDLTILDLEVES